eukprot:gb/GEZJ01000835.1/.p3 GENE.gb/GEZJ01000835.1/~~gb/GEZJ01000835.1/.p3  ORF type:complete len:111 (+),score=6.09 gb/GEZJ01000835.1/:1124-1456(+)
MWTGRRLGRFHARRPLSSMATRNPKRTRAATWQERWNHYRGITGAGLDKTKVKCVMPFVLCVDEQEYQTGLQNLLKKMSEDPGFSAVDSIPLGLVMVKAAYYKLYWLSRK